MLHLCTVQIHGLRRCAVNQSGHLMPAFPHPIMQRHLSPLHGCSCTIVTFKRSAREHDHVAIHETGTCPTTTKVGIAAEAQQEAGLQISHSCLPYYMADNLCWCLKTISSRTFVTRKDNRSVKSSVLFSFSRQSAYTFEPAQ